MTPNDSPWIKQLKRDRPVRTVGEDMETDVAIVGGGIAGISTAYFVLKNTDKRVVLIEAGKVAHGATGHNAGQIVSYFERQLSDLVAEFGLKLAAEGQAHVDSAWLLLEEIYREAGLTIPFFQFTGYAGCTDLEGVLVHLNNAKYSKQANINSEELKIAEESDIARRIPAEYDGLYSLVPHEQVLALLETKDPKYVAVVSARKGCMNSAAFSEEVAGYLLAAYPDRFILAEHSPMREIVLTEKDALLKVGEHEITADRAVLCTNGFERFTITNAAGPDIDTKFHHLVRGSVGYMAAYLEEHDKSPVAISYLPAQAKTGNEAFDSEPYFYLTRRPFEKERNERHNLVCVGGPESLMDDTNQYKTDHPYPEEAQAAIDKFLRSTRENLSDGEIKYLYRWHGLMGYTPNGVRLIGPEPINPVLMYNLGCNGVGILPSIYGGKRVSQLLAGEDIGPSIFDPKLKAE